MTITPIQCRAAREMLKWRREDLQEITKLARETIGNFEREISSPTVRTLLDIRKAFENAGIEFINDEKGDGVKLLKKRKK
ncbi:MAG: helix-turn-helix transcriptional regulator [Pseudomonadota bacterium]